MKRFIYLSILQFFISFWITLVFGQSIPNVVLSTETDNMRKDMSINKETDFWLRNVETIKYEININQFKNREEYGFDFNIQKPELIKFGLYYYNQYAYVTPGDQLSFEIVTDSCVSNHSTIKFTGKDAQNYNYYRDLNIHLGKLKGEKYGGSINYYLFKDLSKYKIQADADRKMYNDFLETYRLSNDLPDNFIEAEQTRINTMYIKWIYSPFRYYNVDRKLAPSGYFKEANEIRFNDPDLLHIYDEALACQYLFFNDTFSNIDSIYSKITNEKILPKNCKEYLLTALIGHLAFNQREEYRTQLANLITSAKKIVTDQDLLKSINRSEEFYMYVNNPFPDDILNTTLLKEFESGGEITLKEMLLKYKDKPVYIDFWASWCGGCLLDIGYSKEIKQLLKDNGVEYAYLALDKNEKSWKKAAIKEGITANQYLLKGAEESPLYKYLKIQVIPQYIFLTSEHKINTTSAPKPTLSYENQIKKMIDSIKSKVVFF